jgi:hypothetical protein
MRMLNTLIVCLFVTCLTISQRSDAADDICKTIQTKYNLPLEIELHPPYYEYI